jgi:hypothetical protein
MSLSLGAFGVCDAAHPQPSKRWRAACESIAALIVFQLTRCLPPPIDEESKRIAAPLGVCVYWLRVLNRKDDVARRRAQKSRSGCKFGPESDLQSKLHAACEWSRKTISMTT